MIYSTHVQNEVVLSWRWKPTSEVPLLKPQLSRGRVVDSLVKLGQICKPS